MPSAKTVIYQESVKQVWLVYRILGTIDFDKLLADIERADALGPIVDPTTWRDNHKAMDVDKRALGAAAKFIGTMKKIEEEAPQRSTT